MELLAHRLVRGIRGGFGGKGSGGGFGAGGVGVGGLGLVGIGVRDSALSFAIQSLENGTQARLIVGQLESVFLRKCLDLCFSIFLIQWPDALQFVLVNCAMPPFTSVQ